MLYNSPFDILAETYDADFTQSEIGKMQRQRVWKFLKQTIQSHLQILEINCGTGEDALWLASLDHDVVATDASGAMIRKAKQKLFSSGFDTGKIDFIQCSFDELSDRFENKKFDLVFSNFGGINCIDEADVKRLAKDISYITKPGGTVILVVMSRFCLWETLYYSLMGKFKTAFRRQQKHVLFKVNGSSMPVFYYSPRKLAKLFHPWFKVSQSYPVGFFIPPSYLEKQFLKHKSWLLRLSRWEEKLNRNSFLTSSLSDHFCIIFKREAEV